MKPISFPKEEIPKLMKRTTIVTTRVDQEFNKYFLNDVLTTPWGDEFVVTSVQVIHSVKKHPNYTSLTQKQIQLLSKYNKMEVIRMKKVKKEVYITCGDYCNQYLSTITDIPCIPFNEAFIKGNPQPPLFTPKFIEERCKILETTPKEYAQKMVGLFSFMEHADKFQSITLFFGQDDFCKYNLRGMLWLLQQIKFKGTINLNIINEKSYEILKSYSDICINQYLKKLEIENP